ncbi:MAG: histidine kinase [Bacteroidota bacterium]
MNIKALFENRWIMITLFGVIGGLQGVLICEPCRENLRTFMLNFASSGSFWMVLTGGSMLSIVLADRSVQWLENPLKRFFIGLAYMIMITIVGFMVVYLFFRVIVYGYSLENALSVIDVWDFGGPIFITFGVNAFMHGRSFLLAWRQDAINYEKLKTEQIATQYDSLKNQVNPHFLFNSLNALTSLVYDDQEKAVEFIRRLSQVYRYVLDTKDKEVVTLTEEMEFLMSYLYLQKIRFDENLQYHVHIPDQAARSYIVPISLQMLLENAIKHNIVSQSRPLTVEIVAKEDCLIVRNNLQEKMHKDSTGIGLSNIKDRYSYMTKKKVVINKTDTHFEVKLPLIKSVD